MYTLESVVCLVIDRAFYVCEHCSLNNCIAALLFELNHQHFKNHLNCGWIFFHPFPHFISISSQTVRPFFSCFSLQKKHFFLHISSFRFILNFSNILINKAVKLHENFEALWVTYFFTVSWQFKLKLCTEQTCICISTALNSHSKCMYGYHANPFVTFISPSSLVICWIFMILFLF